MAGSVKFFRFLAVFELGLAYGLVPRVRVSNGVCVCAAVAKFCCGFPGLHASPWHCNIPILYGLISACLVDLVKYCA